MLDTILPLDCPTCDDSYVVPLSYAGKTVYCPTCGYATQAPPASWGEEIEIERNDVGRAVAIAVVVAAVSVAGYLIITGP